MKPLYLALSGGGAHAAAHAGVLRALEREGVPVAGIAGVSGGALVAAAWAGGADLERLVEQASRLHPWMWVRGLGRGAALRQPARGADRRVPAQCRRFEGLRVPVVVLATDVDSGEGVVFREGSLRDAVRASCSFPGVFPPFAWNGRRLVDGGVTEVVPVRLAREMAGDAGASSWPSTATPAAAGLPPTRSSRSRCAPGSPSCAAAPARSWWAPTS